MLCTRQKRTVSLIAASRSGCGWQFLVLPLLLLGNSNARLHSEQKSFNLPRENYISVPALYSQEGCLISVISTSTPESTRAGSWEEKVTESPFLKGKELWVSSSRSSRGKLLSSEVLLFFKKKKTNTHKYKTHRNYSSITS